MTSQVNEDINQVDLILNEDGSVYHLNLCPGDLAETIILVGDPGRVPKVSKYFDCVDIVKQKREFLTHTGRLGNLPISVISTGMGACNIDIVFNEIDALFNVDLVSKVEKSERTKLRFIRLGTCGGLHPDAPENTLAISSHGFAFDGFYNFYQHQYTDAQQQLLNQVQQVFQGYPGVDNAYLGEADPTLLNQFAKHGTQGITFTCSGFYGAQQRFVRTPLIEQDMFAMADKIQFNNKRVLNLEMETAAIYAMSNLLGHDSISISAVVANRVTKRFSQQPAQAVQDMIETIINSL